MQRLQNVLRGFQGRDIKPERVAVSFFGVHIHVRPSLSCMQRHAGGHWLCELSLMKTIVCCGSLKQYLKIKTLSPWQPPGTDHSQHRGWR